MKLYETTISSFRSHPKKEPLFEGNVKEIVDFLNSVGDGWYVYFNEDANTWEYSTNSGHHSGFDSMEEALNARIDNDETVILTK